MRGPFGSGENSSAVLSLNTIDFNIVEDREQQTLAKGPQQYLLVDREDIREDEVAGLRGRAVPVDHSDEEDWEADYNTKRQPAL